jgi:hypothetical protein
MQAQERCAELRARSTCVSQLVSRPPVAVAHSIRLGAVRAGSRRRRRPSTVCLQGVAQGGARDWSSACCISSHRRTLELPSVVPRRLRQMRPGSDCCSPLTRRLVRQISRTPAASHTEGVPLPMSRDAGRCRSHRVARLRPATRGRATRVAASRLGQTAPFGAQRSRNARSMIPETHDLIFL